MQADQLIHLRARRLRFGGDCGPGAHSRRVRRAGGWVVSGGTSDQPTCPGEDRPVSAPTVEGATEAEAPVTVRLRGIGKRFPGVIANDDINIDVRRGTIHAIVGENGAGKSTLMKILYGVQPPDSGTIEIDGNQVTLHSPADAIKAGVGMVFQHFMLADNFTVLENVVLGAEKLHGIGGGRACGGAAHLRRLRPGRRARPAGRGARRRRPPAGRDPQGALPRRPDRHPGRADRGPGAAGGRRAVRQPAGAEEGGHLGHLHQPQARRGARGRRRDHRDPARHHGPHGPADRGHLTAARRAAWSARSCRRRAPRRRPSPTRCSCRSGT